MSSTTSMSAGAVPQSSPDKLYCFGSENMKLYLADINDVLPRHEKLIDEERRKRLSRFRMPDDRKRCVAGGALTRLFLGGAKVTVGEHGKPQADGICFNLSHSGRYVALAVSECEVGCDIEKIRFVDCERMGRIVFCGDERALILASFDRLDMFFRLWTKKEALLKCMGEGFHRAAKTVDVSADTFSENGLVYRMKTLRFSDYLISVCSTGELTGEIEFVDLKEV